MLLTPLQCQNVNCPICTPVKEYVRRTRGQSTTGSGLQGPAGTGMPHIGGAPAQLPQMAAGHKRMHPGMEATSAMRMHPGMPPAMMSGVMPGMGECAAVQWCSRPSSARCAAPIRKAILHLRTRAQLTRHHCWRLQRVA